MKKGIKNLAIATMVGIASMGLMTGCKKEEAKPYIQVSGLDVAYIQNEDINLEGAKILYYSDKNDTTADEIKLTESMIANFDTDTTGEKKMKVLWNNFELEINYSVISTTDFINLYNTAYDNLMNAENVHADMIVGQGVEQTIASTNVKNNKFYAKFSKNGQFVGEEWVQQYNNCWYYYELESEDVKRRTDISEEILNNNVMEYCMNYFIALSIPINNEIISECEISYEIDGLKTILTFSSVNAQNETSITQSIIENEKFIGADYMILNSDGTTKLSTISTISYNIEEVEMVDLPTDVEWSDVVEG